MKKISLGTLALVAGALFVAMQFASPAAFARSAAVTQMGQSQQNAKVKVPSNPRMTPSNGSQIFWGTVKKQNGHYVLTAGQFTYKLNDQSQLKKYAGEQVQVTGKLNPKTNKIKVKKIKKAGSY